MTQRNRRSPPVGLERKDSLHLLAAHCMHTPVVSLGRPVSFLTMATLHSSTCRLLTDFGDILHSYRLVVTRHMYCQAPVPAASCTITSHAASAECTSVLQLSWRPNQAHANPFFVQLPLSDLNVVRRKAACHSPNLSFPPVVCRICLFYHLNPVTLLEGQITLALSGEVIERRDVLALRRRKPLGLWRWRRSFLLCCNARRD